MKTILSTLVVLAAMATQASAIEILSTSVLKIDYTVSGGPLQPGFTALDVPALAPPATFGPITVAHTGQQGTFNRGTLSNAGAFTYANLYNDFIYNNGGNFQVKISGLNVSDTYQMRLYVYDDDGGAAITVTNTFTPISGTLGAPGVVVFTEGVVPTTNTQYSTLVDWISNSSGEIEFNVSSSYTHRLSGFELFSVQVVPEPSTLALLGLAVVGLAIKARRRRASA